MPVGSRPYAAPQGTPGQSVYDRLNQAAQQHQQQVAQSRQDQQVQGQRQYETGVSQTGWGREQARPDFQMGEYQVQQARRSPIQKGTDAGTALRALQESSGLNLLGSSSSFGSGYGPSGVGSGNAARVTMPDTSAANAAIFARGKDQAGQTSRAAIDALRGSMAERGLLGSGIEGGETARIVGQAAGGMNEITREQSIQDAANLSRQAQTQYGGDITQRGQDLAMQQQMMELKARQEAQAREGLLSVINSSGVLY